MHFMLWHGHIDWGDGEMGGFGVVVAGRGGVFDLCVVLSLSSNLCASLFWALSHCQCLVTLPSLMAFLCSIYAPLAEWGWGGWGAQPSLSHPIHLPTLPPFFLLSGAPLALYTFFSPLINTQCSRLSTPHITHIWPTNKLWMGASHITSKISIVFVNGWSILHLASSSKLSVILLSVHFHPLSLLPFFVCLWFWFAGSASGAGVSRVVTNKKVIIK